MPRVWTLNRLRGRLERVERAKEKAMQAMIVQDQVAYAYPRYAFQDPGQVATMLDEIAALERQIAELEGHGGATRTRPGAAPRPSTLPEVLPAPLVSASEKSSVPVAAPQPALDVAFEALLERLKEMHRANQDGRVELHHLQFALRSVLTSEPFLYAVFARLKQEMMSIQGRRATGAPGPDALRDALMASLIGHKVADPAKTEPPRPPVGATNAPSKREGWPNPYQPGVPPVADRDGWHWLQFGDQPAAKLFWNARQRTWSCSIELSVADIAAEEIKYRGPMR